MTPLGFPTTLSIKKSLRLSIHFNDTTEGNKKDLKWK